MFLSCFLQEVFEEWRITSRMCVLHKVLALVMCVVNPVLYTDQGKWGEKALAFACMYIH